MWLSFNLVYRCSLPLGLENGHVPDAAFSASSSAHAKYAPARARLNLQGNSKAHGAWCAKTNDGKQWLQIDFGELVRVTKVATQGQQNSNNWVTKFTLYYSVDGIHWAEYKENSVTWVSVNLTNSKYLRKDLLLLLPTLGPLHLDKLQCYYLF